VNTRGTGIADLPAEKSVLGVFRALFKSLLMILPAYHPELLSDNAILRRRA
jgi:hypothetical protein